MTQFIDIFYFNLLNNILNFNTNSNFFTNSILLDCFSNIKLFNNLVTNSVITYILTPYVNLYLDIYYSALINYNYSYIVFNIKTNNFISINIFFFSCLFKLFKINLFFFIIFTIYIITNFENYIKQLKGINSLAKLFILNANEKDIGPLDDYFFFAILFFLTISLFIFSFISLIMIQNNIFIWALGAFLLLSILILTIPISLFIDFGIVFCVAIKGSASSNNLLKELLFDIISTTTVFIRFVIQNIRFLFIFAGIFELLEWTFNNNNSLFVSLSFLNSNLFFNNLFTKNFYSITSFNILILNTLMFILLYLYYFLHLLFLLLVQISIYIGISIWLFFFLYSTKFLNKLDKHFLFLNIKSEFNKF